MRRRETIGREPTLEERFGDYLDRQAEEPQFAGSGIITNELSFEKRVVMAQSRFGEPLTVDDLKQLPQESYVLIISDRGDGYSSERGRTVGMISADHIADIDGGLAYAFHLGKDGELFEVTTHASEVPDSDVDRVAQEVKHGLRLLTVHVDGELTGVEIIKHDDSVPGVDTGSFKTLARVPAPSDGEPRLAIEEVWSSLPLHGFDWRAVRAAAMQREARVAASHPADGNPSA